MAFNLPGIFILFEPHKNLAGNFIIAAEAHGLVGLMPAYVFPGDIPARCKDCPANIAYQLSICLPDRLCFPSVKTGLFPEVPH